MKKTKILNLVGVLLGIILIIIGIVFTTSADSVLRSYAGTVSSAKFGADFYTEIHEASRYIAANTYNTYQNVCELVENIGKYVGLAFIMWGLFTILSYLKAFFSEVAADSLPSSEEPSVSKEVLPETAAFSEE